MWRYISFSCSGHLRTARSDKPGGSIHFHHTKRSLDSETRTAYVSRNLRLIKPKGHDNLGLLNLKATTTSESWFSDIICKTTLNALYQEK
jgi:hypothetical protein